MTRYRSLRRRCAPPLGTSLRSGHCDRRYAPTLLPRTPPCLTVKGSLRSDQALHLRFAQSPGQPLTVSLYGRCLGWTEGRRQKRPPARCMGAEPVPVGSAPRSSVKRGSVCGGVGLDGGKIPAGACSYGICRRLWSLPSAGGTLKGLWKWNPESGSAPDRLSPFRSGADLCAKGLSYVP